jgi:uncharacterized protein YeaO (DUF488 family)
MSQGTVKIARIYDEPASTDGVRVLVDRLWPRGVSKQRAQLDEWLKTLAPSTELREWYGHVPSRYPEFRRRYIDELDSPTQREAIDRLGSIAKAGPLTLLTATKDPAISEAAVIAELVAEPGAGTY